MANVQKQFEKFHKTIRVDDNEDLRKRRDIILDKIKDTLREQGCPVPELLNQGSYIYGVGIKPISKEQEYDIDVGLVFNINPDQYKANNIRKWVYDAVKNHTQDVEEKGPCIRVCYQAGYHVDLVCYAHYKGFYSDENFRLAHKDGIWKDVDPKGLKSYIVEQRKKFKNSKDSSGSDQLQRVVRYLKRWNDKALPEESDNKPIGLALLLLCIEKLPFPMDTDLQALQIIVRAAVSSYPRISVKKPTPEYEDIFGRINDRGMKDLIERFSNLNKALQAATSEESLENACKILREEFGDDFPLEEDELDKQKKISAMDKAIASGVISGPNLYGGKYPR